MPLFIGLILMAVGAILTWAVHPANPGSVDVNTVGVILMVVGLIWFLIDLLLFENWGPRLYRSRAVVADGYARPAPPAAAAPRRRTVVEDEVVDAPAPGPPPPGY